MSKDKAQNVYDASSVGKRIRFLRGDLSQAAFAERVGVSRAALANYETGRTAPKASIIEAISEASGVSTEFLASGKVNDVEQLAVSLGMGSNTADQLTADEWAVIRILAVSKKETIQKVIRELIEGFKNDEDAKKLADLTTIEIDLTQLLTVDAEIREYQRGVRRGNLNGILAALAHRLEQIES